MAKGRDIMAEDENLIDGTDDFDEDWEEEPEEGENNPLKSLMIFGTLVVLAGIICAVVWMSTHQGKDTKQQTTIEAAQDLGVNETLAEPQGRTKETAGTEETAQSSEMEFADCAGTVTPKEYVNLRTEPSTTGGDATVYCQVNAGDKLKLTGYNLEHGWSRVEYDGRELYVVTSLVEMVIE